MKKLFYVDVTRLISTVQCGLLLCTSEISRHCFLIESARKKHIKDGFGLKLKFQDRQGESKRKFELHRVVPHRCSFNPSEWRHSTQHLGFISTREWGGLTL